MPTTTKHYGLLGTASSAYSTGALGMGKTILKSWLGETPLLPLDFYSRGMSRPRSVCGKVKTRFTDLVGCEKVVLNVLRQVSGMS